MPSTRPVSKPRAPEALLELGHVVAPEHRTSSGENPVAEAVAGLDQEIPGLRAADPVDPQPPAVLEGLQRGPGGRAEHPGQVTGGREPEGPEPATHVTDGLPPVALDQGQDGFGLYRYGCELGEELRSSASPRSGGPGAPRS